MFMLQSMQPSQLLIFLLYILFNFPHHKLNWSVLNLNRISSILTWHQELFQDLQKTISLSERTSLNQQWVSMNSQRLFQMSFKELQSISNGWMFRIPTLKITQYITQRSAFRFYNLFNQVLLIILLENPYCSVTINVYPV